MEGSSNAILPSVPTAKMADLPECMGFVGIGTINSAVIRGLMKLATPPKKIVITPRNAEKAGALKAAYPETVTIGGSGQDVVDACDIVFLGTPPGPEKARISLSPITFRAGQTVISLIAGVSPGLLAELCSPATTIVQGFPLPPAEDHMSTTLYAPPNSTAEAIFSRLGTAVAVKTFDEMMTIATMSCVMGDFYAHMRTCRNWLQSKGIEKSVASSAVGSYFQTFSHASSQPGADFDDLVAEQTPGGMNEFFISHSTDNGKYANMVPALDSLLKKFKGE